VSGAFVIEGVFNNNPKTCQLWSNEKCDLEIVQEKCKFSCDLCGGDGGSPTSAPITAAPTPPPVSSVCEDVSGTFVIEGFFNDNPKTCQQWAKKRCGLEIVKEKCKVSCDMCGDGGSPTSAPITAAPIQTDTSAPSPAPVPCEDKMTNKFTVPNKNGKKNCKKWTQKFCKEKSGTVAENCQKSCGLCVSKTSAPTPTPCEDSTVSFPFKNGNKKCPFNKSAAKIKQLCRKFVTYRDYCPKLCGECTDGPQPTPKPSTRAPTVTPSSSPSVSPTRSPTVSPTANPSETPSSSPSVSPTRSPTVSPTANPSETPTVAPTEPQCNLVGKLWFPEEPESNTFRIERLFVTKAGRTSICSDQKDTTWGCTAKGDAEIYQNKNEEWKKKRSITTLSDAFGGNYKFTVQHIFDDREKDFEINAIPVLTITVNGVDVAEYNVNGNKKQLSHDADGYANSAFKDHTFVNVSCDDACVCTPVKSMPICPVRVEVRMPKIDPIGTPNYGYHRETMSVNLNGSDESCSPVSTNTKWCTHEGKAEFYRPADDYYYDYDSISTTESIVIPEALGKSFDFTIKHIYDDYETYYSNDHTLNGDIVTFVDGKKKVFKRDIDKDTHIYDDEIKDWVPNPEYDTAIFLQLVCDDGCDCTIEEVVNTSGCQLTAKLKFPNFENMVGDSVEQDGYYGYHNDFISIQKQGEEEECYYGYSPKWDCSREGDAKFWFPNRESFTKHTEQASIADGSNSHHRFSVNHYYDEYYGEKNFPKDQMKQGVMQLTVNNKETKSFSHPYNEVEPRFDDGTINPAYKGKTYVDVTCDSECECDIVEHIPGVCEVDAVLAFPPIPDGEDYYGYHESGVYVSKKGEEEACGFYYPLVSWGCSSTGQAFNSAYDDDTYKDSGAQEVNIVDATNSRYTFHMRHYYSELLSKSDDHKIAELDVKVNGASIGKFKRPDADFDGTIKVNLACDKDCNCAATV